MLAESVAAASLTRRKLQEIFRKETPGDDLANRRAAAWTAAALRRSARAAAAASNDVPVEKPARRDIG